MKNCFRLCVILGLGFTAVSCAPGAAPESSASAGVGIPEKGDKAELSAPSDEITVTVPSEDMLHAMGVADAAQPPILADSEGNRYCLRSPPNPSDPAVSHDDSSAKLLICHVPAGNPQAAQALLMGPSTWVNVHKPRDAGDAPGACGKPASAGQEPQYEVCTD